MSPAKLFERAVHLAPDFAAVLVEHLRDNDVLLPHVLMPSLLGFIGDCLSRESPTADATVQRLLDLLEVEVSGDDLDTQNLIAVSFLENLEAEPFFGRLYPLLGPNLQTAHAPFAWRRPPDQNAG
jgi:hypothetical protein